MPNHSPCTEPMRKWCLFLWPVCMGGDLINVSANPYRFPFPFQTHISSHFGEGN